MFSVAVGANRGILDPRIDRFAVDTLHVLLINAGVASTADSGDIALVPKRLRVIERFDLMGAMAIVAGGGDHETFFLYGSAVHAVLIGPEKFLLRKVVSSLDGLVGMARDADFY
jgi:hypothetical protein